MLQRGKVLMPAAESSKNPFRISCHRWAQSPFPSANFTGFGPSAKIGTNLSKHEGRPAPCIQKALSFARVAKKGFLKAQK